MKIVFDCWFFGKHHFPQHIDYSTFEPKRKAFSYNIYTFFCRRFSRWRKDEKSGNDSPLGSVTSVKNSEGERSAQDDFSAVSAAGGREPILANIHIAKRGKRKVGI